MPVINPSQIRNALRILIFIASLLFGSAMLIAFFNQIPIEGTTLAIDWNGLWHAIEDGIVRYNVGQGFRIAPWDAVLVLPLGFLSMRASWGLIGFITLTVLIMSVPPAPSKRLYWVSILLLVLSFPSLRHMADGNFEALVIAGVILIVYGYREQYPLALATGILLAVAKPQETILAILALAVYALPNIKQSFWLKTGVVLAAVILPFMFWKGADWLTVMFSIEQQGSIMDMSLRAALNRTEFIPSAIQWMTWIAFLAANGFVIWRSRPELSREKAGMLVAASLLISPYSAGNSILTVLAVGIIPLFHVRPRIGSLLIFLVSLPYLWTKDMLFYWQASYGTAVLLLAWGIFAWRVLTGHDISEAQATDEPLNVPRHTVVEA
jgi:hypothetical protein